MTPVPMSMERTGGTIEEVTDDGTTCCICHGTFFRAEETCIQCDGCDLWFHINQNSNQCILKILKLVCKNNVNY